jgi:hypothetical protein
VRLPRPALSFLTPSISEKPPTMNAAVAALPFCFKVSDAAAQEGQASKSRPRATVSGQGRDCPRIALGYARKGPTREAHELLGGQHRVDAFLFHHDHHKPCRLRRACVPPDRVHIVRAFVESLSWRQGDLLAAPYLLDVRPF